MIENEIKSESIMGQQRPPAEDTNNLANFRNSTEHTVLLRKTITSDLFPLD